MTNALWRDFCDSLDDPDAVGTTGRYLEIPGTDGTERFSLTARQVTSRCWGPRMIRADRLGHVELQELTFDTQNCPELLRLLDGHRVLTEQALDALLARPELIPDEWRSGPIVFFFGSIVIGPGEHEYVPYLDTCGGLFKEWYCVRHTWEAGWRAAVATEE